MDILASSDRALPQKTSPTSILLATYDYPVQLATNKVARWHATSRHDNACGKVSAGKRPILIPHHSPSFPIIPHLHGAPQINMSSFPKEILLEYV